MSANSNSNAKANQWKTFISKLKGWMVRVDPEYLDKISNFMLDINKDGNGYGNAFRNNTKSNRNKYLETDNAAQWNKTLFQFINTNFNVGFSTYQKLINADFGAPAISITSNKFSQDVPIKYIGDIYLSDQIIKIIDASDSELINTYIQIMTFGSFAIIKKYAAEKNEDAIIFSIAPLYFIKLLTDSIRKMNNIKLIYTLYISDELCTDDECRKLKTTYENVLTYFKNLENNETGLMGGSSSKKSFSKKSSPLEYKCTSKTIMWPKWPKQGSKSKSASVFPSKLRKVWQNNGIDYVKVKGPNGFKFTKV